MDPYQVIKNRHITEKARMLENLQHAESSAQLKKFKLPKYVFIVAARANKTEIAAAIEAIYADKKIKVVSVNTINVRAKPRMKKGILGKTNSFKKAIVTLAEGNMLDEQVVQ